MHRVCLYVWKRHYGDAGLFYSFFSVRTINNRKQSSSRLGISTREEGLAGRKNNVLSSLIHIPRRRFSSAPSGHVSLLPGAVTAVRDCGHLPSGAHRRPVLDPCILGRLRGLNVGGEKQTTVSCWANCSRRGTCASDPAARQAVTKELSKKDHSAGRPFCISRIPRRVSRRVVHK